MPKVIIGADKRILPAEVLVVDDADGSPVVAFQDLDPNAPLTFRNAGTVTVMSALSVAIGISHGTGAFNNAVFINESTGVFKVAPTAQQGSAWSAQAVQPRTG